MSWILSCGRLPDTRTRVSIGRRWGDIQSWMLRFTSKLTPHHIPRLFVKHSQRCHVEVAPRDHPVDHPPARSWLTVLSATARPPNSPMLAPEVHLLFQECWFQGGLLWPWTLEDWSEKEQTLPSTRWHVLCHFCHGQVSEPFSVDTRGEEESICCSARFAIGDKLIGWVSWICGELCIQVEKMGTSPFFVSMLNMTLISSNHHCYQSKRQNVRKHVKRLMVQKSVSPVEVGSLSHCLQGFIHPTGGWPWDFFHQKHKVFAGFWRPRFAGGQCRTERLGGRLDGFFGTFGESLTQVISDDIGIKGCDSIWGVVNKCHIPQNSFVILTFFLVPRYGDGRNPAPPGMFLTPCK